MNKYLLSRHSVELLGSYLSPTKVISETEQGVLRTGLSGKSLQYVINISVTSMHGLLY